MELQNTIADPASRRHHLSYAVYDLHKKYGDFVRLSPDHVSVAHPDSIRVRRSSTLPVMCIASSIDALMEIIRM